MSPSRRALRKLVIGVAAGAGAGALAQAATLTWQNTATSSDWSLAGNWGGTAPTDGDDLVFTNASGAPAFGPTNNDVLDLQVRSLTFVNNTFNGAFTVGGQRIVLDGTLGATHTIYNDNTNASRIVTVQNDLQLTGDQTWSTLNNANSRLIFTGTITGADDLLLTGRNPASLTSATSRNINIAFQAASGESNSTYTGTVTVSTAASFTSAASYFSGASEVRITNLGQVAFAYAVTTAELANLRLDNGSDFIVSGTSGSLAAVDLDTIFANTGTSILLDNYTTPVANRLGGPSRAVHLDDFSLHLHGHSSTNPADTYTESIGALTYEGAVTLQVRSRNATSSKIALVADSLSLAPGAVGTLNLMTTDWDDLNGLFLTNSPTVTNGIINPGVIISSSYDFSGLRTVSSGAQSGRYQPIAFTGYTNYVNPTTWTPGSPTEVAEIFFNEFSTASATLSANTEVYALKFDNTGSSANRGLNLSGYRLTIGSGGLIFARIENEDIDIVGTTPGSELAFGSQTAYIYTHGAASTASGISAPISGTGGLVKHGAGGLELTGTNTFTGGIYINEGSLFLGTNDSLNNNVVTLGATGVLNIRSTPTTNILAGLNGLGEVRIAGGQGDQTLRINTATGETHTSSAVLYNVGGTLSVEKSGAGTQIFTGTRTATSAGGTSTGTTSILAGTLVVDGDWSATTGDVITDAGATLSGGGILGGATLIEGTLAPGHLTRRGDLRFLGNLGLATNSELQLDLDSGATRGTTYDAITVGGTFALGGRLSLNVTTLGAAEHRYQLFDFVASTGNFDQVSIVGVHNSTLTRSGNIWSGVVDGRAVSFDQTIGEVIVAAVPEPATCAALAGFGALAFASLRRKPRA